MSKTNVLPEVGVRAREPERFAPIFVLATPRSYSSVVTSMVGQHPELAGLPELRLFAYSTIGDLDASLPQYWRMRGATHRSPGLVRAVAQFEFGGQDLSSLDRAQGWLRERSHWSGSARTRFSSQSSEAARRSGKIS